METRKIAKCELVELLGPVKMNGLECESKEMTPMINKILVILADEIMNENASGCFRDDCEFVTELGCSCVDGTECKYYTDNLPTELVRGW